MPRLEAIARVVSMRFGLEFVLLVAVVAFIILERGRVPARPRARSAVEVLVPIAVGAVLVALTVAGLGGSLPATLTAPIPPRLGTPSAQGALLAFLAMFLSCVYRWRAAWSWALAAGCAAAQLSIRHHGLVDIAQGWLVGAGFGMLLFAFVRPSRLSPDT